MKKLFSLIMLLYAAGAYSQGENFNDYRVSGSFYDYLVVPVIVDHNSFHDRLVIDSVFRDRIKKLHSNLEYYVTRATVEAVRQIVVTIFDEKYKYMKHERMIGVVTLERELEQKMNDKFTRDTMANMIIKNGVMDGEASLYKILHALADYHGLRLQLKGSKYAYGKQAGLTLNIRDLHRVLCVLHQGNGICGTLVGNKLIVEMYNFNNCKLDCE